MEVKKSGLAVSSREKRKLLEVCSVKDAELSYLVVVNEVVYDAVNSSVSRMQKIFLPTGEKIHSFLGLFRPSS